MSNSRGPAGLQRLRDDSIASNESSKMGLSHVRVLESLVVLQPQSKQRGVRFPQVFERGTTALRPIRSLVTLEDAEETHGVQVEGWSEYRALCLRRGGEGAT